MGLPASMRAAVYRSKGRIDVEERPLPDIGPEDVLLEVSHCGVCGTDLHLVMDGWGRPESIGGHEYSGTIVAVGEHVSGIARGARAVGGPTPGCGRCEPCRAGRPALCRERGRAGVDAFQGAFAEYKALHRSEVVAIPDGLSLRDAALAEPLAVALHGITLSGIEPGQRALVTGAGPIGALTVAALRAIGVDDVAVSEPATTRRELAAQLGASRVLEPGDLELPKLPFQLVEPAVHAAFECSGRATAIEAALAQLRPAGRLVLSGTGMERPRLDAVRVILQELVVTGAYTYDAGGFETALELLASRRLPLDLLIEREDVGLDGLQRAMERLVAGRIAGKVLVDPARGTSRP